jgi:hypothetical protein
MGLKNDETLEKRAIERGIDVRMVGKEIPIIKASAKKVSDNIDIAMQREDGKHLRSQLGNAYAAIMLSQSIPILPPSL